MRFRRWHRSEPYRDTSRKRAAFEGPLLSSPHDPLDRR